jgi:hypothetical protein
MMKASLAGHLPLQDLIAMTLEGTREKLAASEGGESDKAKKLVKYEKESHGHIPSVKEEKEEKEKSSSVLDFSDPDQVEKLASALEEMGDGFLKMADEHNIGGEAPQGGLVLPTASPNAGKQNYNLGQAKTGKPPMKPGSEKMPESPAATALDTNLKTPPGKTPYPAKGVLKVSEAIKTAVEKQASGEGLAATVKKAPAVFEPVGKPTPVKGKAWSPGQGESGGKGKEAMEKCNCMDKSAEACPVHGKNKKSAAVLQLEGAIEKAAADKAAGKNPFGKKEEEKASEKESGEEKEKKSEAVGFILDRIKVAESAQGGLTQDTPSEEGPKAGGPADGGNGARSNIGSIQAAIKMTKLEGKTPQKKMLSEVLTEKAQKKSTDPVLQDNLRNTGKAGVKIAAARAFLQKIAEGDDSDPRKKAFMDALAKKKGKKEEKESGKGEEKKSNAYMGTGDAGVAPMSGGSPTPNPV